MSEEKKVDDGYKDPLEGKDIQVKIGEKSVPLESINKPHGISPKAQPGVRQSGSVHGTHHAKIGQNPLVQNSGHRPTLEDAKK